LHLPVLGFPQVFVVGLGTAKLIALKSQDLSKLCMVTLQLPCPPLFEIKKLDAWFSPELKHMFQCTTQPDPAASDNKHTSTNMATDAKTSQV